uniref:Lipoxygenase domain-containing protein n=1 Tax=Hucho hucho TaxID=62062 RepID=A0A4W5QTF9_9TELE
MQSITVPSVFVTKAPYTTHHCDLYALVGWSSLHIRRQTHWLQIIYKSLLGKGQPYLSSLVTIVIELDVSCPSSLGHLEFVVLESEPNLPFCFLDNDWFCSKVVVTTPEGDTVNFPCYHWISGNERLVFREATGQYVGISIIGLPQIMKVDSASDLPAEVRFSFTKDFEFEFTNWKEDTFFGYQLLNGLNPMMIHRCSKLPENFPVTEDMVKASLFGKNLEAEIQVCQHGVMYVIHLQYNMLYIVSHFLAAPLCLLYMTPEDKLIPIAIQLKQEPGDDNPIFLPTDSEYDWLLAKIFVRNADFVEHELNFHLLRTHLLAEVFAVSTLRNLPMVHPLYKLLISHFRYTLQINTLARQTLISENGVITKNASVGGPGMMEFLKKAVASLTYSSLCIPEDIIARGLESIPNFFYKEDGLKLWDIVHSDRGATESIALSKGPAGFALSNIPASLALARGSGLLMCLNEVVYCTFSIAGIPQSFSSVTELVKFLTMLIFTVSVQHAAVSNGQFDFGGWMPNFPISLQQPLPTTKGQCTESTMLKTFPDINTTVNGMAVLYLLSTIFYDFKTFHDNPNRIKTPLELIHKNQDELKIYNFEIQGRNVSLPLSYTYLNPNNVENSVAL